jgi:copper oxidase (laccase) domain-containing protein
VICEIVARTVEALATHGSKPADLQVAIGPCIQKCCFEVDGDLPQRFEAAFGREVVVPVAGKARQHLDLPAALRRTLERCGVDAARVETLAPCTVCDPRFYSHRRDQGRTGRHLSFISCTFATAL